MTNILLSRYDISKRWCVKELKKYINKGAKVAVVAFSFGKEIPDEQQWNKFYGGNGALSNAIETSFKHYGVSRESIEYINYFTDTPATAKSKLQNADIIYFPGGAADKIMERVIEFELYRFIEEHSGVVIGFGAGAQVQLANYHISNEYSGKAGQNSRRLCYSLGFRFAEGFDIEPNYKNDESQNYFIKRVVTETGAPVYAIGEEGAIIVNNGKMNTVGDVHCFRKREQSA